MVEVVNPLVVNDHRVNALPEENGAQTEGFGPWETRVGASSTYVGLSRAVLSQPDGAQGSMRLETRIWPYVCRRDPNRNSKGTVPPLLRMASVSNRCPFRPRFGLLQARIMWLCLGVKN